MLCVILFLYYGSNCALIKTAPCDFIPVDFRNLLHVRRKENDKKVLRKIAIFCLGNWAKKHRPFIGPCEFFQYFLQSRSFKTRRKSSRELICPLKRGHFKRFENEFSSSNHQMSGSISVFREGIWLNSTFHICDFSDPTCSNCLACTQSTCKPLLTMLCLRHDDQPRKLPSKGSPPKKKNTKFPKCFA